MTDKQQRVKLPDAKPGQVWSYELVGHSVKLTPLKPVDEDVPIIKPIRRPDGTYQFPENAKLTREEILAAIRADRDSR